ncbi:MAG: Na/Pi cotransporter family protein [Treponema sp.]|jgi:phosphate:Na+ symporter|nr:Na/Pi cotransporter family protein [Treponema sp.]
MIFIFFRVAGGLCLFLYGMNIMSDGIQRVAGDRMQRFLNFMTGNRFMGVFVGFAITAIIQSSSATTVMVVSLVNAGLLSLTQSIGVIMGANIGTTVTAWIVSLIGFSLKLSNFALPAVGIGFIFRIVKWKYRDLGDFILGFGLLFLGLGFLSDSIPANADSFNFLTKVSNMGFFSLLISMSAGLLITLIVHSSSASTAIILTMSFNNVINYEMAAAMILGANIGTTIDAALAAIGTKTNAKRAALVHVLFNVIGTLWALPFLKPLLALVNIITPMPLTSGLANDPAITARLAMLHTVFNTFNMVLFLPLVNPFAKLVSRIIKDDITDTVMPEHYKLVYLSSVIQNTPEMNILRAEKEIRDMAGLSSSMFSRISTVLLSLLETNDRQGLVMTLKTELLQKEQYADEMHDQIGAFLMECMREQVNYRSEQRISQLLRIISDLEDMTDDCCSISHLIETSVSKNRIFSRKEMDALAPYLLQVKDFLILIQENLGHYISAETLQKARSLENQINENRDKLRNLGRKRLEAGKKVETELLFIELVRRIEKLGDYCSNVAETLAA